MYRLFNKVNIHVITYNIISLVILYEYKYKSIILFMYYNYWYIKHKYTDYNKLTISHIYLLVIYILYILYDTISYITIYII